VRIDPAIDGHNNTVVFEESLPLPMSPDHNPRGNGYQVVQTPITKSSYLDASPFTNRTIKITNPSKINPISQKPVGYKFIPSATQLLIADPESIVAKRAQFAQHHVWVTKYKEGELWAGGEFTNQSKKETDGVADAVRRNDDVQDADVVVWNVFGLTHNPRVEDWPVMPVEIHQLHLRPADFFLRNPALDVPGLKNEASVLVMTTNGENGKEGVEGGCCGVESGSGSVRRAGGEQDAVAHLQGTGPDLNPVDGEAI
jgi:primary-amine oxidase